MMFGTELASVDCPYCGESLDVVIDTSVAEQRYVEDCQVCCRPMTLCVSISDETIDVSALHENDY